MITCAHPEVESRLYTMLGRKYWCAVCQTELIVMDKDRFDSVVADESRDLYYARLLANSEVRVIPQEPHP